jgi:hypothetical protein
MCFKHPTGGGGNGLGRVSCSGETSYSERSKLPLHFHTGPFLASCTRFRLRLLTRLAALGTRQWFSLRGMPPWVQEAFGVVAGSEGRIFDHYALKSHAG